MILTIKKKSIIVGIVILALAVSLCFAVSIGAKGSYSAAKVGKTVVIDAGHGGADGGVVGSVTGAKESDINLAIARNLKHFLKQKGYDVVMTRSTTDGLYGMNTKNKKQKDMAARKKIIEESKADLLVSVHCNSYPRSDSSGPQVFYAPHSDNGKTIASIMQNILNTQLSGKRLAMQGDYFILQCSSVPSILVECGFLTNASEEKLLLSAPYQEKVAYNIFMGITAILADNATMI